MREVNVALIGYAFMGRAHSNAWRQVGRFLSPKLTPRLKVLCGRDQGERQARGGAARLGRVRDRLARGDRAARHRRRRRLDAGRQPRRDRDRRRPGGQGDPVREAARQRRARGEGDVEGRAEGRRHPHALPQLPPHPRRDAGARARGLGQARPHLPLPRHVPAGLVHRPGAAALLALPQGEGRLGLARRHPVALARPRPLRHWLARSRRSRARSRPSSRRGRCRRTRRRRAA